MVLYFFDIAFYVIKPFSNGISKKILAFEVYPIEIFGINYVSKEHQNFKKWRSSTIYKIFSKISRTVMIHKVFQLKTLLLNVQ